MRKMMICLLAVLLFAGCLSGCAKKTEEKAEPVELIVFAAASLEETLTEIGQKYEATVPGVRLVFNFDSSGTLKTQIAEGAECDLFISAAPKQMNQLDKEAGADTNPDGLDFVLAGTRCNLLENKVALTVPEGNPKNVTSFTDMIGGLKAGTLLAAIGNSDVPVGQYTQKIFAYFEVDESTIEQNLSYGTNVKDVTSKVSESAVDCGVVYATDAFSAKLEIVDTATKEMCGQVIYPAAVLNITKHEAEAKAFLEYLKGTEAGEIFSSVGFTPLS